MIVGCFALVEPVAPMKRQFEAIREMGFDYADLTDNHNGGMLGTEYGFAESISLDSHPADIRALTEPVDLTLTAVCAHANLLDPVSPARYGPAEIIKAIKLAHFLGVEQVVTTEGEPKTRFGHELSREQMLFTVAQRLHEPIRWAEELGVQLLLEPHGPLTDRIDGMRELLDRLGHENVVGVNLDTGNCWLGGEDPVAFVRAFGRRIQHVHWKDMGSEWEAQRGRVFGTGMTATPLGDGRVGIRELVEALLAHGFDGPTTLEIAGAEPLKQSAERLREWAAASGAS